MLIAPRLFHLKHGCNCPLLWHETKIKPPSHVIAAAATSPQCYPLYSIYSIYSVYSIYSIYSIYSHYPPTCSGAIFCARPSMLTPTPTPTAAVFFRRSRLFFREATFFSGGEGCEWGAKQPTVGSEWGYNGENSFSALSPFVGARKGFSPHIPASRLFVLFHPSKATKPHHIKQPLSKIAVNERAAIIDHLVAAS